LFSLNLWGTELEALFEFRLEDHRPKPCVDPFRHLLL
jgi:hypothetical protein